MDQVVTISTQLMICMIGFVIVATVVDMCDKQNRLKQVKKWVKITLLFVYIGIILYETILFRPVTPTMQYELVPFWSYRLAFMGESYYVSEILLNYLLYIPLGFLLKAVFWRMRWWQCIAICLCSSCAIEVSQLIFHVGLFEWDDMIGNTIGGWIGYGGRWMLNRVVYWWRKR